MPSPFPGMNPYLEHPTFWSSFHTRLLVAISDALAPVLRPHYYIEVETRTYREQDKRENEEDELLVGIPDAAVLSATSNQTRAQFQAETSGTLTQKRPQAVILPMPILLKERYLEVRELGSEAVITVIEVLSPKNKKKGVGRIAYERKRGRILGSRSNLVEIDLLRSHAPMTMMGEVQPTDYRIVVSRSEQRPEADLYGFNLPEPIPVFPLPLKPADAEPPVNLQVMIEGVCDRAGYHDRIDYRQPVPAPKLSEATQQWVDDLLAPMG
ncbi:hypothetical protein BST81_04055 [Leptolyngbya sp. 'hensonii']|nr:hypothetical protein BST81_04055 [Leptolyngbya sp. 'hensonii']